MSLPRGRVSALLGLINKAASTIEKRYAQSAKPYVPSLDDKAPHPCDSEITPPDVRVALQTLEGACAQLCATMARPQHTMVNKFMNIYESGCIHVATRFKITDILEKSPNGMHTSDISKQSGIDEEKLGRILRYLATRHIYSEVRKDVFANNRLSMMIHSKNPLSDFSMHIADENNKGTTYLAETLADPIMGPSRAANHTPWNMSTGFKDSLFEWYAGATPKGAEQGKIFNRGMIGWGDALGTPAVIRDFPWSELPAGTTVCDVGGGVGAITMQLAKKHPHLQLRLQDVPGCITTAQEQVWPKECPEAIKEKRIEFKPIDFFTDAPIEGCDIYFMKNIIHDWPNKECVTILKNIKKAMKANSRVLIHEYVITHATRAETPANGVQQAPEPLLANYGAGNIRQYNLDMDMMVMLNSKERTLEEFIALGEGAGLRFVKVWQVGEMGLVEFQKALVSRY